MAVYTQVSEQTLKEFLSEYNIGSLLSYEGIEKGVSNTNYFITTDQSRFVLTLFEPRRVNVEEIPFFLKYVDCLEKDGIPCPRTIPRLDGKGFGSLCGRPAVISSFQRGEEGNVERLNPDMCEKAGEMLARMHLSASSLKEKSPNRFGLARWKMWIEEMGPSMDRVSPGLYKITKEEFDFISDRWVSGLPSGAIHGDYFPDNIFFENENITAVIDFHFVSTDLLSYDLAIACNAWCFDKENEFRKERMDAFLHGYQSVRALTQEEEKSLPVLLRATALRFLLSRIEEKLNWKPDDFMIPHDPMVFEKRLRHFQGVNA